MTSLAAQFPVARLTDLVITEASDELLVFDTLSNELHHLNAQATAVWRSLDGKSSINDIVRGSRSTHQDLTHDTVTTALAHLANAGLVEQPHLYRLPRRTLLKATGVATIVSITAPLAAAAATPSAATCTPAGGEGCLQLPCCPDRFGNVPACNPRENYCMQ